MVGVSCTFSIDKEGHCSILYIKEKIEINPYRGKCNLSRILSINNWRQWEVFIKKRK
jgi:hypothetical protein